MTNSPNSEFDPLTRTQVLTIMAVTAIILLVVAKVWQYFGAIAIPAIRFTLPDFLFGLALAGAISAISGLLYRFWTSYRNSANAYLELVIKPLAWPDLIWIGLLPGLSEELLFRGVILPALGLNLLGLTVSSLIFGILHFSGSQQWPYVIWATIVGFALGYTVIITGNLLIPIVAHIITNLLASFLWKMQHSNQ